MAPRTTWRGHLRLSLVSCPVRLYPATTDSQKISFNQLHGKTHSRINMKPVDPKLGLVDRSELVRGYEYEKGRYLIIEDEDLDAVKIEATHTINIESFVDASEIGPIWQDKPYYLAPDGRMAEETFIVLREAMREAGKAAIGRLVLSSRERMITISPEDKGMFIQTLRAPNEVRAAAPYFEEIPDQEPDREMLELAEALIEKKTKAFDPTEYEDRYEAAVLDMIRHKLKGEKPKVAEPQQVSNVVDLMDALRKSLSSAKPVAKSRAKAPAKSRSKASSTEAGTAESDKRATGTGRQSRKSSKTQQ